MTTANFSYEDILKSIGYSSDLYFDRDKLLGVIINKIKDILNAYNPDDSSSINTNISIEFTTRYENYSRHVIHLNLSVDLSKEGIELYKEPNMRHLDSLAQLPLLIKHAIHDYGIIDNNLLYELVSTIVTNNDNTIDIELQFIETVALRMSKLKKEF